MNWQKSLIGYETHCTYQTCNQSSIAREAIPGLDFLDTKPGISKSNGLVNEQTYAGALVQELKLHINSQK